MKLTELLESIPTFVHNLPVNTLIKMPQISSRVPRALLPLLEVETRPLSKLTLDDLIAMLVALGGNQQVHAAIAPEHTYYCATCSNVVTGSGELVECPNCQSTMTEIE